MKKRNYKRIYKPGTLMRIEGSNTVFMSLGLNPKNDRQIFSFNGIDIVERKTVKRADGKARPANKWEQTTYWAVMKEVIAEQERQEAKPKFEVGDWIVDRYDGVCDLVIEYVNDYYVCESSGFPKHYETQYRLWNIRDARIGDLLYDPKTGFILWLKEIKNGRIKVFCSVNEDGSDFRIYDEDSSFAPADDTTIRPADAKQREMLIAKTREAGYDLMYNSKEQLILGKIQIEKKEGEV